jgi:hypothetical protein
MRPKVTLLHCTQNPERVIERCGQATPYRTQHTIKKCMECGGYARMKSSGFTTYCQGCFGTGTDIASAVAFIRMLRAAGDESLFRHVSAGFSIVADRETIHRLALYSGEVQLETELCMTANFCEWRRFLQLQSSSKAHPQMHEVAEALRIELLRISAVCFEDIP